MEITRDTKLIDIISVYPWLKDELVSVNEAFKRLATPMGKIMIGKVTIDMMSKRTNMDVDELITKLHELIHSHK